MFKCKSNVNYNTCIKLCNSFSKEILYMYLIKIENSVTFRTVHNVLLYFVSLRLIYVGSSSCPEAY